MADHNPNKIPKMNIIEDYMETLNTSNEDARDRTEEVSGENIGQTELNIDCEQENFEQSRPNDLNTNGNMGNGIDGSVGQSEVVREQANIGNHSDLDTDEGLQYAINESLQLEFEYCLRGLNGMNDLVREITPEVTNITETITSERPEASFYDTLSDIDFVPADCNSTGTNSRNTTESRLYQINNVETITLLVNRDNGSGEDTGIIRQADREKRRDLTIVRNDNCACNRQTQNLCKLCQQRFGGERLESKISQIDYKLNDLYIRIDGIYKRFNWRYE
jgi:hypothetical protein